MNNIPKAQLARQRVEEGNLSDCQPPRPQTGGTSIADEELARLVSSTNSIGSRLSLVDMAGGVSIADEELARFVRTGRFDESGE